jgi:hypothetical protein
MTLRHHNLRGRGVSLPRVAIEPLTGLQLFRADPWTAVWRAQDEASALSRSVHCSFGLRGDAEWRSIDTDPDSPTQIHANSTSYYTVARSRFTMTPGCGLCLEGAFVPSGATNMVTGVPPTWVSDGAQGYIRITVTWIDNTGATETTVIEQQLKPSNLEFGATDQSPGGLFRTLNSFVIDDILPPDFETDTAECRRFSLPTVADVHVEVRGSPRIVDAHVSERPVGVAFDLPSVSDPIADSALMTSHMYAHGNPVNPLPPPTHALARHSRQGVLTARAQSQRLNPKLLHFHAYTETGATPTATVVPRTTSNDGTTFESLLNSSQTGTGSAAYASNLGGWSVSCGGYARRWASNNHLVLRDRIACIPVIVRVYGRTVTAGTGTVRVQTARHSYVDCVLPVSGSNGWTRAFGWLETGITPEQPRVAQILVNHLGASGSLSVEAVCVEGAPNEAGFMPSA